MAVKKSELYASLWKSCDELRGGMDASQYKDYVLVLLFMKYVSDRYAGDPDGQIFVPEGSRFHDLVALKGDKEIGDKLNKAIAALAEENDLTGVITLVDFNDPDKLGKGREMVDRLSNLIGIFNAPGLDFSGNRAEGDDLLGDAYEFLMRHFATESGKSKGQFYTPAEVSTVMARLLGIGADTPASKSAHDPTCGSGSLLLKVAAEAPHGLTLYGQEMDNATSALAKMNMILHDCTTGAIEKGNTLSSPQFRDAAGQLKTFDYVVANPPFSSKAWSNGLQPQDDEFGRFVYGVPPEKNGDYAFLLHILKVLKSTGRAAVILPHGVLFRGGAEGLIRQRLLKQGFIQTLIGLPANLFYGTGIPACILVLDKSQAATRDSVFVVDASRGFRKDGNKNRLRAQDIHRIVDVVTRQVEAPRYARRVPLAEIEANDWNLNIPRYIDGSEPEDLQDIEAHLRGGIPRRDIDALQPYWAVFPGVRAALFEDLAGRPGHVRLKVPAAEIRAAIFGHAEFAAFNATVSGRFAAWRAESTAGLRALAVGDSARALVRELGESILARFEGAPLIDAYDVYQHLMDYWDEVMQDDVAQIVQDGWRAQPNAGLIPMALVVARYFAADAARVAALETVRDGFTRRLEELEEEHGGEDGLLNEARTDKGKLTAASVKARLKAVKGDPGAADERVQLEAWLALNDQEADAGRRIKDARKALETKAARQYATLTDDEIRALVIDDKWMTRLAADVQSELDRVSQGLTGRVRELGERYAVPLPTLIEELSKVSCQVDRHLKAMHSNLVQKTTHKTDLGQIPGEWSIHTLGDKAKFRTGPFGSALHKSDYVSSGIPIINPMHIFDGKLLPSEDMTITENAAHRLSDFRLKQGEIIIGRRGDMGRCAVIRAEHSGWLCGTGSMIIRCSSEISPEFLQRLLTTPRIISAIEETSVGSTMVNLNQKTLAGLKVQVPPTNEQKNITSALADIDAEIIALEARREKTRLIKQGMMQELLSGRVRLI